LVDKLQKAGASRWYNKERLGLGIMVAILGYRVYFKVISPPPTPDWPVLQPPQSELPTDPEEQQQLGLPGNPAPRPPMDVPGTYASLYGRNPFWYHSGQQSEKSGEQEVAVESVSIQLLDIQEAAGGKLRARLRTTSLTSWYSENAQFEEFELQRINKEDQTVEVYSERYGRTFVIEKK